MRLVLVQHGDKEPGPGDPALTSTGRDQARRTARAVAALGRPAAIYSSPFRRAAETASLIAEHFGLVVQYDHRLQERLNWEGPPAQSIHSFLADWEHTTRNRDFVPGSGDSSRAAAVRMLNVVGDIAESHPKETVVAVTHGGVTIDLLRTLLGDERLRHDAPSLFREGVPCCALTTLRRAGTGWRVKTVASDAHLHRM